MRQKRTTNKEGEIEQNLKRTEREDGTAAERTGKQDGDSRIVPLYSLLGMEGLKRIKNNRTVNIKDPNT